MYKLVLLLTLLKSYNNNKLKILLILQILPNKHTKNQRNSKKSQKQSNNINFKPKSMLSQQNNPSLCIKDLQNSKSQSINKSYQSLRLMKIT